MIITANLWQLSRICRKNRALFGNIMTPDLRIGYSISATKKSMECISATEIDGVNSATEEKSQFQALKHKCSILPFSHQKKDFTFAHVK